MRKRLTGDVEAQLAFALETVKEAGALCRTRREAGSIEVASKESNELVTNVDLMIHEHFRQAIARSWPTHRYLSEEHGALEGLETTDPLWIVDPLDGTANYVRGLDHVAISVALSVGGIVQLGVVHAPFCGETFWSVRGGGAWRDGIKICPERHPQLTRAAIATGFPHDRSSIGEIIDRLPSLLEACGSVRVLGAPALDICWVADGRLTGFIDRIFPWDVAAAGLIAEESGVQVTKLQGDHLNGADYLIAAHGAHDDLLALLR